MPQIPFFASPLMDSGVTEHMINGNRKIAIVEGYLIAIASVGNVHFTLSFTLINVLHVHTFFTNLMLIKKLVVDL